MAYTSRKGCPGSVYEACIEGKVDRTDADKSLLLNPDYTAASLNMGTLDRDTRNYMLVRFAEQVNKD